MLRSWLLTFMMAMPLTTTAETLRFTADPSCPYVCPDPHDNNKLAPRPGIVYEILTEILAPQGYAIKFEFLPYRRGLKSVRLGEQDALMVTLKDDAPSLHYHQTPIALARGCFVTRKQSEWQFDGIESLKQIRFGGTLGYKYGPLKAYIDAEQANTLMMAGDETFDRLLQMVKIGRLDATIEDINVIRYKLNQTKLDRELRLAGCLPPKIPLYVGLTPNHPNRKKLAQLIDNGIRDLGAMGILDKIVDKYDLSILD